jgi:hypothetical protein
VVIRGFRIKHQDGYWVAIKKEPGQRRKMIRVGTLEQAEEKITRYISMKG